MKTHQTLLKTALDARKKRNARYSLRSFAKLLEMSPAQLSSLINGKKNLTPKQAAKMIKKLQLDETEAATLMLEMLPLSRAVENAVPELRSLSEDEFALISDWFHFAILSLSKIRNHRADPVWIAERLGLEPELAAQALRRLQRLGLIVIEKGKFRQTSKPLTTTTDIPSVAIRSYHRQNLQLAQEKIDQVATDKRLLSSITMATTPAQLERAKKKILNFKHKLCKELECDEPTEVYTLGIQLFPVTQIRS